MLVRYEPTIVLVTSPATVVTSWTMLPRLSTMNLRMLPFCVMLPRRPSTAPMTVSTSCVTLLSVLIRSGLRSREPKTRLMMSTRWPRRTTRLGRLSVLVLYKGIVERGTVGFS